MIRLFQNKKGVDMQDWFGIVFSVAIGALVFFGVAAIMVVSEQHEQRVLKELQSTVDDSFFLATYLRTPLPAQEDSGQDKGDDQDQAALLSYISQEGLTIAHLIDLVGNEEETEALFRQNQNLPRELQDVSQESEEIPEMLETILLQQTKDIFTSRYGILGWAIVIDYPEEYSNGDIHYNVGGQGGGRSSEARIPTLDGRNNIIVRLVRNTNAVYVPAK